jgi:prepilin-type processing-associated H-X9-DG protein
MKLKCQGCRAFSFIDFIMIVAALAVLAFVMLPLIAKRNARSSRLGCTNYLKQIGLAYRQWAIDNGDKFPMQVSVTNGGVKELVEQGSAYEAFLVMSNELNTPKLLVCPQDTNPKRVRATTFGGLTAVGAAYQPIPFTNNNNISYFVGLDADETAPQQILSGDDNFLVGGAKPKPGVLLLWTNTPVAWTKDRHVNQGNVGLADGSVMGVSTPMLGKALINTGMATNRLAMP